MATAILAEKDTGGEGGAEGGGWLEAKVAQQQVKRKRGPKGRNLLSLYPASFAHKPNHTVPPI